MLTYFLYIKSVCLSLEGKEFHIVGAAKENEQCQNVFVHSLGILGMLLSEDHQFFWVRRLRLDRTSE